jgi:hypothetical protein
VSPVTPIDDSPLAAIRARDLALRARRVDVVVSFIAVSFDIDIALVVVSPCACDVIGIARQPTAATTSILSFIVSSSEGKLIKRPAGLMSANRRPQPSRSWLCAGKQLTVNASGKTLLSKRRQQRERHRRESPWILSR